MSSEKMPNFSASPEKKKELGALQYINLQMKEAISEEDYEQAVCLRDIQEKLSKNNQPLPCIRQEDILEDEKEKSESEDEEDSPAMRAWQGIESKQMADLYVGKDIVKSSSFSHYLKGNDKYLGGFARELWDDVRHYKHLEDLDERTDYLSSLHNLYSEAQELRNIAKAKIDNIFQMYNKREPILKADTESIPKYFPGLPKTQDILRKKMEAMPDFISEPLAYWNGVYDNSSQIADDLELAIKEMTE
ncbi:MAG: hypothetical protein HY931_00190 [Candidatus Falkowbacteria bacterium]|nr:MAG: hypothetical protein HY931_00190 [Candidatus Falkowbacteria bacterium]